MTFVKLCNEMHVKYVDAVVIILLISFLDVTELQFPPLEWVAPNYSICH